MTQQDTTDWSILWPTGEPDYTATEALERPEPVVEVTDRVWVHLVWELVLAVAVVVFTVLVLTSSGRPAMDALGLQLAGLGLLATGTALSLRAAAPNLAMATAPVATGAAAAWLHVDRGVPAASAVLVALGAAVAAGLLLGLIVVILNVPSWAASLGAAALVLAVPGFMLDDAPRLLASGDLAMADLAGRTAQAWLVFGGVALASVLGGWMCAASSVRGWLGGRREVHGRRPGAATGFATVLALAASTALAGGAGVVALVPPGIAGSGDVLSGGDALSGGLLGGGEALAGGLPGGGVTAGGGLTVGAASVGWVVAAVLALGAVLVGGVSALGRRGGVFGTVLGVELVVLLAHYLAERQMRAEVVAALPAMAVLTGLMVNRVLERAGRRTRTVTAAR
jgi:hypothetical protein